MTDGASQGLFVIVAVVIFGIFVLISYILFKDTLKPSLTNIFTDGLEQAEDAIGGIDVEDSKEITEINVNSLEDLLWFSDMEKNQTADYYSKLFRDSFEVIDQDGEIIPDSKLDISCILYADSEDNEDNIITFEEFAKDYSDGHTEVVVKFIIILKSDSEVYLNYLFNIKP